MDPISFADLPLEVQQRLLAQAKEALVAAKFVGYRPTKEIPTGIDGLTLVAVNTTKVDEGGRFVNTDDREALKALCQAVLAVLPNWKFHIQFAAKTPKGETLEWVTSFQMTVKTTVKRGPMGWSPKPETIFSSCTAVAQAIVQDPGLLTFQGKSEVSI